MDRTAHPIETLSACVHHAALSALPDLVYEEVDSKALFQLSAQERQELRRREQEGDSSAMPKRQVVRRPTAEECEATAMFPQTWGSTALGFGGLGGQAMTRAYTIVIQGPDGTLAVYWNGRLGYLIPATGPSEEQRQAWKEDLRKMWTAPRREASSRYGAKVA